MTVLAIPVVGTCADIYELESCQHLGTIRDSKGRTVPPGLDEPLNCDHKCFYDELGLKVSKESVDNRPNLHDMYSIGWRLIQVTEVPYKGRPVWTVYLERKVDGSRNACDATYAPKRPASNIDNDPS